MRDGDSMGPWRVVVVITELMEIERGVWEAIHTVCIMVRIGSRLLYIMYFIEARTSHLLCMN